MVPETFDVELISNSSLAPSVRRLVFARADERELVFDAGQWLNLVLPLPSGEIRRAYSIASPPNGSPRFELAVTEVTGGPGSGYLASLAPGAKVRAVGPQGFFTRAPLDPAPALMVATGTGVTPFYSMMQTAVAAGSTAPIWLLLGVRREADLLYRTELEALAAASPTVRVHFTLSQGAPEWIGRRGYVQSHVPELYDAMRRLESGEPHIYVCGLERMVSAVRHLARKEMGFPRERVHSERYD
ncbi:MAG TPA: FAD-dependent oxidoreductase [Polyangiaceae bacterium]|nr:FAD-dependent oxidoreductase [Polyangiaceae bacterium]